MGLSETLQEEQVGTAAGVSSIPRKINSLLNSPKTRNEGLELLHSFLPNCPDDDFLQFCVSWMQNCCKTDGFTRKKDCAIQLLSDLFKASSNFQELKKSVSFFITTRYFDFFFKHLLHSQAGWSCMETCMLFYRGACGPYQDNLTRKLESETARNEEISSTVAHCYALLPSVGGGGSEGMQYGKNWKSQFVKFISIGHSILEDLFADVEELQDYEPPNYTYKKAKLENSPAYLAIQFHNHCTILNFMLLSQFPSPKSIPIDLTFQLICRGLAVSSKSLANRPTTQVMALQKILPQVHYSLLSLLKAVIVTCKSQLLPYSHLVCKLISQTLEWSESDVTCGIEKLLMLLRVSAYEVLCNWLTVTGSGSCVENISNVIISNAISDITPKKKVVTLKETKQQNKSKNQEQTTCKMRTPTSDRLSFAALKALQFLLKFVGISLKPDEHKFLQETVVKIIVEVQRSVSDPMPPFAVPECRLELYALLLELVLQPCPKWPPPTHFTLRLLTKGLNDGSPQISSFCSSALSMATIIIHPQYCNGGFPSGEPQESSNQREVQLQWKEVPMEVENVDVEGVENVVDTNDVQCEPLETSQLNNSGPKETADQECDESDISSNEDSRNTVTFSNEANDINKDSLSEEVREEKAAESPVQEEPSLDVQTEEAANPGINSQTLASEKTENKNPEPDEREHSNAAKSLSPDSATDESQVRKRYFLRSATKGSSEEPEEAMKRTFSVDSLKSASVKGSPRTSPNLQTAKNKRVTRASVRLDSNFTETPKKSPEDDDDDIMEVFDDSLVE